MSGPSSLEPIHAGVSSQFQNILFPLPHARFLLLSPKMVSRPCYTGFSPASEQATVTCITVTNLSRDCVYGGGVRNLLYLESLFKITMSSKGMKVARGQQTLCTHWPKDVGNGVKGKRRD